MHRGALSTGSSRDDTGDAPTRDVPDAPRPTRSIGEALDGHRNSLGLLRLVLASLVIFDHAFPLGGYGHDPVLDLTRGQATLGSIAVGGFFAISGYLIAKSGMNADILQFMWRRFLRVFPAFWTLLVFTAVVVGPIFFVLEGSDLADYFQRAVVGPVAYVAGNWTLTINTYGIYDIFATTTPYGEIVGTSVFNGSLWTLAYEWACYLLIGVLVAFGVLLRARLVVPLLTALMVIVQILVLVDPEGLAANVPFFADRFRVSLTLTFLLGSCMAVYAKRIPYLDGLGILSGILVLVTLRYGGFDVVGVAAGAYFVLYLGARLPRAVQWIGAKNDYSYGIYIYGFLVQQILAFAGVYRLGYVVYALAALMITAGLAWLSWHGVEKRAMALKDWGPGRGWRHWWERMSTRRRKETTV